jgi:hypothetical protein
MDAAGPPDWRPSVHHGMRLGLARNPSDFRASSRRIHIGLHPAYCRLFGVNYFDRSASIILAGCGVLI